MPTIVLSSLVPFQLTLPNAEVNSAGEVVCDLSGFIGGAITASTLEATGAVTFDDTLDVAGNTGLGGDLDVTGATTLTDVSASGTADFSGASSFKIPGTSPLNSYHLQVWVSDAIGANGKIGYVVVPPDGAGTIEQVDAVADVTTATGNLVLTSRIDGAAVTSGAITIPSATSAGTAATPATPSAANIVAAGDVISVVASGTQSAAGAVMLTFQIQRTVP